MPDINDAAEREASDSAAAVRELNDAFRADAALLDSRRGELVVTRGVASRGPAFVDRAARKYRDFGPENDPWGEHDFGRFELDDVPLYWKIDYYDDELEYGSPDPADESATRRVLTLMLAQEY